ncbi:integrase_H2C2 domain-containing protein [Trichonephila clavipes]|nr:integrase_H2C2 domain-containing protein [Trichonephila clavipes]
MEDHETTRVADGNKNKNKIAPVSAFPEPVIASPVPVSTFTVPVKLSTYDGKTNWEVYKIQFSIISEANGWTVGVKAFLGCGRTGYVSRNCPRVNQEDLCRTSVIEPKKISKGNGEVPLRRTCLENRKYCSRIEKKSGVIDQVVSQVTTLSTAELDPWSDDSVRKDQRADPEIKHL